MRAMTKDAIKKVAIFGVPFSKMNMRDTVDYLTAAVDRRETSHVITANPIMVMAALEDPKVMQVMKKADLIVPDGAGIVWAANYVNEPVAERVAGFDLLHELMRVGESKGWTAYLLGTTDEIIQEAAKNLQLKFPGVRIVGVQNGFFGPAQDDEVIARIKEASPDLLFVARAANNQDPWISQHRERLGVPVMMGVGGSFDIISGKMKRAPVLFQKLRLEWFYRLLKQPSRYRRMLALPKFMMKVMREKENVTKP